MEMQNIYKSVKEVLGLDFCLKTRKTEYNDGKFIFAKICIDYNYTEKQISDFLDRDRSSIYNLLKRFNEHIECEKQFKLKYIECINFIEEKKYMQVRGLEKRIYELKKEISQILQQLESIK